MDLYLPQIKTNIRYAKALFDILEQWIVDEDECYVINQELTPVEYKTDYHDPNYSDDDFARITLIPVNNDVNHPDNEGRKWTIETPYPWSSIHMIAGYEVAGDERYISIEIYDDLEDDDKNYEVIIAPFDLHGKTIQFTLFAPYNISDDIDEFKEDLATNIYHHFKQKFRIDKKFLTDELSKFKLKTT